MGKLKNEGMLDPYAGNRMSSSKHTAMKDKTRQRTQETLRYKY